MTAADPPLAPPARSERVSLMAVAREADVSLATASRALSGGAVRPVLQERVEKAARRLGYRPDLAAQAVARGATKTVALIVDYLRSPFGVEITRGVVDAASKHDLVVNVTGAETHPGDLLEMIASARALRPRSIVLATGRVQDPAIRDELIHALDAYQASGGSVAIVEGLDLPFASCAFDEVTAARALTNALVELGYRRPLVFNSSSERADLAGRTHALIHGLESAGLPGEAIRLVQVSTEISSTSADDVLLDLGDADVVLCVEGTIVPAVYRHIRSLGLRVGADVAVTAFGQYGFASALRPHLTTVMLPLRRAGELALQHALTDTTGAHVSLPCNLRIRASSPYRHSVVARGSSHIRGERARTGTIGVLLPALPSMETGVIVRELFDLARASGRRCVILNEQAWSDTDTGASSLALFDAMLVWGSVDPTLAELALEAAVPYVVVDLPSTIDAAQLSIEVVEGMQALLEHLYALGHVYIVYLAGVSEDPSEALRRRGVELFSSTHGDVTVRSIDTTGEAVDEQVVESELADGATALIAHSDLQAARTIQALINAGRDVPGDVSVAGFGGEGATDLLERKLTTVRMPLATAVHTAWRMLEEHAVRGDSRSLRAPLLVRDSTGAARQQ